MSATGLDVFEKTLQTTNTWLEDHIAPGEIEDVRGMLPTQLRRLWPEEA